MSPKRITSVGEKVSSVGKLQFCLKNWQKYTKDPWLLNTVSGYEIEFCEKPFQLKIPQQINFSAEQKSIVNQEIEELLNKGAIEFSQWEQDQFISNIFVVPKSNGKYRPIINLKSLNSFVQYEHFKQETFNIVLDLIQENDFFTSIDLQDAYFAVPIHKDYRKFLKFSWNGQLFSFSCLPFGLSSAPKIFTKILRPIYAWFRQHCIRCSYYIDDSLNMDQNSQKCSENTHTMVSVLESLGFTINKKKSVLVPVQTIIFFGFVVDSVQFMVFLTKEKVQKIIDFANFLLDTSSLTVRQLASFIGLIINTFFAVLEAPLHYRNLERDKILGLKVGGNFDTTITLSDQAKQELLWWKINVQQKNGKRIRPCKIEFVCKTDASSFGWGSYDVDSGKEANGRWNQHEKQFSINYLELLAIFYALQSLYSSLRKRHIEIQSDNVSAVSYINDMGGMNSRKMDLLAHNIWDWCVSKDIFISAIHVPGLSNVRADFLSRHFSDSTEWGLKRQIFERICKQYFLPDIDLFASRLNKQINTFVSWFPEPGAYKNDAFSFSWNGLSPYIFAPFNMIGKVVNKIIQDEVERAILIAPLWRSQAWFPLLLENLISYPIRLPCHRDLLTLPHNKDRVHPLAKKLKMVAVMLSGNSLKVKAFQNQLLRLSSTHGGKEQENNTVWPGTNGIYGVLLGVSIPLVRLKI